ncbi:M20/M25/M40 family metallo-hydrolase [Enhygromyxa salina]|uniref:M20/M25/M40 family metallo-hydrolase n=1 Tax=Enhygromyxa salina TaxID=215803 RepID=UPI0013FCF457|nr:M20/M25/M40 family metallo-hydrolase [Enhygromyxa salina]
MSQTAAPVGIARPRLAPGLRASLVAALLTTLGCASEGSANTVWAQPAGEMPLPVAADDAPSVDPPTSDSVAPRTPALELEAKYVDAATKLTALAEDDTRAWDRLAYVADTFGHRLSGSKALEQTIDWAIETMAADGLTDARREKVMVPHWVRGKESAEILGPVKRPLPVLGLGMTVGTPGRGITAEVIVVADLDELDRRASELAGKIVVINQAMPGYDHERHDASYGSTVQIRAHGPSKAGAHGAKAVLVRSVTASSLRTLHTGALNYAEDQPKIPAAAITPEDAEWFMRMAARGETIKVRLSLGAKLLPDAVSANAVAELRGREKPEEIVVIGGHIDSWDVGDGSTDDGSGCLMAMEAALMLKELNLIPRRTIRVVLFTNEENGLRGGKAYAQAHADELHVAGIESDSGAGAPWGFGVGQSQADLDALLPYAPLFTTLGADNFVVGGGGADISPLTAEGMLGIALRPDTSHYFDLHHSPADTIDKIPPYHLERNAAALALMAYILAERDLPPTPAEPPPAAD